MNNYAIDISNQIEVGNWIKSLISDDNLHEFYTSTVWLHLRAEVLEEDRHECQDCKTRGFYTRATTVHHDRYVKKYPHLALSKMYVDQQGKVRRQLISLCHNCHERRHQHRQKEKPKPLTEERW